MENTFYYPYYKVNYRTFNGNCPYNEPIANNLISAKDGQIVVQPMWRMEILGKHFGINIGEYEDNTNWDYYFEKTCNCNILSEEEKEKIDQELYRPDTFDDYFERLAEIAAWVGCKRAEIKCLIKSLLFKYRANRIENVSMFPHEAFNKLYNRLISSNDIEQLRVAQRLSHYHIKQFEEFLRYDVRDKIMRVNWAKEE